MKIHITRKQIVLSTLGTALLTVSGTYLAARLLERALAVPVNAYIGIAPWLFCRRRLPMGWSSPSRSSTSAWFVGGS